MNAPDAVTQKTAGSGLTIAYQGAPGAYSHMAARSFLLAKGKEFGLPMQPDIAKETEINFSPCKTFQDVFEKVKSGDSKFGVIPLANSSVGTISTAYELMLQYQVSLVADVYLPIHHMLVGLPQTEPKNIKTVISHPVALKQCTKFLAEMSWAQPHGFWDTSGAAFHVREMNDPTIVAIAGEAAARITGLTILSANIEDFVSNETRFGIIAPVNVAMQAVNNNFPGRPKLSFCVELDPDQIEFYTFIGATIARYGAKVSTLITLPIPERTWQYLYIFDLDLSSNQQTQSLWTAVRETATKARILGIYNSIKGSAS